ncbi:MULTISPECIES: hypothetical protein [Acinetobacter]|uniref:hypothetical protein n=1 Tax=Acinetobacter TaxID=469 RepID=UPI00028BF593|nr:MULTISPECIES: hypothetical protein [Acinetobacter]EKU3442202.1 hypothetical protein [Acinetobacter baumannii]MDP7849732.1 hypothetical protein [Acinetobacter baumannii]BBL22127.1 hypothetical protein ACRAD_27980 [Acinetobacter radioresistens DSM 6976 = NBRC 102413 = CIP 103788]
MNKILLLSCAAVFSLNVNAASWQPIGINKSGTKLYIDKDSILMNADRTEEVLYKSRLEASESGNGLNRGELLIATETINCVTATKTLYSLIKYNPAGKITYKTVDDGRAINVVKIAPNSIYTKVMDYLCPMLPSRAAQVIEAEPLPPIDTKNTWSYVAQDDNVLVQIDDLTIIKNPKNKLVAFTSKLTSKAYNNESFPHGDYLIAKNLADCEKGTVARLHIAQHDRKGKLTAEERYSYNDLKFRIANDNQISGSIQKYVCKPMK